jgi:hypothetical protein
LDQLKNLAIGQLSVNTFARSAFLTVEATGRRTRFSATSASQFEKVSAFGASQKRTKSQKRNAARAVAADW